MVPLYVPPSGAAIPDGTVSEADLDVALQAKVTAGSTAVQPADLGGAALLDVGTTAGTVAAGDDSRVVAGGTAVQSGELGAVIPRLPRYPESSSIITLGQSGHGWTGSTGFVANDTADFCIGTQSMKMPTAGTGATYKIEKTGLSVNTTDQQIRIRVKVDNVAHVHTIQFLAGNDASYTTCYTWTLLAATVGSEVITEGEWVAFTLPFSSATVTGGATRTGIAAMKMTVRDDNTGQVVTGHLQSVELVDEPSVDFPNGIVSITFDDSWATQWPMAAILNAAGLRGSFFTLQDKLGAAGRLTEAQLLTLQDQGHEICAHAATTAVHTSTWTGSTGAAIAADTASQIVALREAGFRGAGSAYPSGAYGLTSDLLSTLSYARRFTYMRTVCNRTMETFPPAEPHRLRAQSAISTFSGGYDPSLIYTDTTGKIDLAKGAHSWLILVFHALNDSPASTSEITTAAFQAIIDKIVSSGITCLPIGDVLAYYKGEKGDTGATGPATPVDVQVFTSSGTWTKPTGAKSVRAKVIGAGGGGGGGARSGTTAGGGGSGCGGGESTSVFDADSLTATVAVTVGTGGGGGAGATADNTSGSAGSAGSSSAFGTYLYAMRGTGGGGGTTAAGGAGGVGGEAHQFGNQGVAGGYGAAGTFGNTVAAGFQGCGAGGSGGGATAANFYAGGDGYSSRAVALNTVSKVLGGQTNGANGAAGWASGAYHPGGGGGGGAGANSGAAAGNGGAGGNYGSGGGGGGGGYNTTNGGTGGAGANGVVVVTTYF